MPIENVFKLRINGVLNATLIPIMILEKVTRKNFQLARIIDKTIMTSRKSGRVKVEIVLTKAPNKVFLET